MTKPLLLASLLFLPTSLALAERNQIHIVGSSTVFPFSSYVAEEFGAVTDFRSPKVESTGSGGGHKLFMAGIGEEHPDITNSSRPIKARELENNLQAGIEVIEIPIGFDGIVVAQSRKAPALNLSLEQIALAVAEKVPGPDGELIQNPYKTWKDIDPSLPDREIKVLGPPSTSGTHDAFQEMVLHEAAAALDYPDTADGKADGKISYQSIRQDGAWVESGEDDNLIVQKIAQDEKALGVFGYSFLMESADKIAPVTVGGVAPTTETVGSGQYPISRSLFIYVKKNHLDVIPGLSEFVDLFIYMVEPDSPLVQRGLIPLPEERRAKVKQNWEQRVVMKRGDV